MLSMSHFAPERALNHKAADATVFAQRERCSLRYCSIVSIVVSAHKDVIARFGESDGVRSDIADRGVQVEWFRKIGDAVWVGVRLA